MGLTVDAHSDILNDIHPRRLCGERSILKKHWLPLMKKGGINLRVLALYSDSAYLPELALRRALNLAATLYEELEECDEAVLCLTYQDIIRARKEGRIGFILGMEGAEPLGMDLQLLKIFHRLGLRLFGPCHALRTYLGDGAHLYPVKAGRSGGLSSIGVRMVEEAQDLGMIIDVSHMNELGFGDVLEFTSGPVIASHSNCRALLDHPRNLYDEQIKALAERGGVIGINACSLFFEHPDLDGYFDHIDHLVKVGGLECAGLGPDLADYLIPHLTQTEKERLPLEGIKPVTDFESDADFPRVAEGLLKRGYHPDQVDRIMGLNFDRVFREILDIP